jgi:Ca-activated chloride channel family protein
MSPDQNPSREDRDTLLTAYAIDAATPEERAVVERLLAAPDSAAARAHVAEVRATAAALKAARAEEMPARSADLRRAVLATSVGPGAATPSTPPRRTGRSGRLAAWMLGFGSCAAAVAMLLVLGVESVRHGHHGDAFARRDVAETEALLESRADKLERSAGDVSLRSAASAPSLVFYDSDTDETTTLNPEAHVAPGPVESWGEGVDGRLSDEQGWQRTSGTDSVGTDRQRASTERYARFADNRFITVGEQPLSTFSIDVDTASYANLRRFLTAGRRPPRDAVRIEELVNYFRYEYPQPDGDTPFSVTLEAAACPWRPGHRLVRVGLRGRDVNRDARPAGNLVFLVDVSGSMNEPNKLPLVQRALTMLVDELTENDRVAIVTYAGNAGLVLASTSGDQKQKIRGAIEALQAGGSTHGSAGINLAYEQAAAEFIAGGANRVILCTDGDLNVGVTSDEALVDLITKQAGGGTFLTVLGFGDGNLQDEKLEKIADHGNGVYAVIDGVREARKVLVEQLTGSTITIAKDVKIQVEFNPAQVASYRLLGYENRILAAEDFRDDTKDAGEIGAGHTVTALYEVALVGEEAGAAAAGRGAEPLKYQPAPTAPPAATPATAGPASRELLTVKLRWKQPDGDASTLLEVPLAERGAGFDAASADLRFAAAVAAFGMILRDSQHKGTASLPLVAELAGSALGRDEGGYRAEFLDLVRRAEVLE